MSTERWAAEIAKASKELVEAEKVMCQADEAASVIRRRIHRLQHERAKWIASTDALANKLAGVSVHNIGVVSSQRIAEPPPAYCQEHGWWDSQLSPVLQGCPRCSLNAGSAMHQQDALAKAVQGLRGAGQQAMQASGGIHDPRSEVGPGR